MARVRVGEERRHGRRDGAAHRMLGRFQHRHLMAERAGDRSEFKPDEAGADHHHVAGLGKPRLEIVGIGQSAQIDHAVEVGARHPGAVGCGRRRRARDGHR
jgi:hypothetical protein